MRQEEYIAEVDRAYGECKGAEIEARLIELADRAAGEHGGDSPLYASMLSELGGFYRGQRKYEQSEQMFRRAVDLLEQAYGPDSPNYATAMNNLAGTYRVMGRWDDAEAAFQTCLRIYEQSLGRGHILYASGRNNLGLLALDRGDTAGAAEHLACASEVLRALPECREEYATSLMNLGSLYLQQKRYGAAKDSLTEAIALHENELGTRTPHYHTALNTLGIVYCQLGELSAACGSFEKAAAAAADLYGTEHPEYQKIMDYYGRVKAQTERPT